MRRKIIPVLLIAGMFACSIQEEEALQPTPTVTRAASPWESKTLEYPAEAIADELTDEERELVGTYNWRSERPYREDEIRRLKYLSEALPGSLSLTPLSLQAVAEREAYDAETDSLGRSLDREDSSLESADEYFDRKEAYYRDRVELLAFVAAEVFWDEPTRAQHRRYLGVAQGELAKFEAQRVAYHHRYEARTDGENR